MCISEHNITGICLSLCILLYSVMGIEMDFFTTPLKRISFIIPLMMRFWVGKLVKLQKLFQSAAGIS